MNQAPASYDDWKAPSDDGQMLIWPDPVQLLADARANHRSLAGTVGMGIQAVPLAELRRKARQFIGHTNADQPLIATGHQSELIHPGVWVKNALIHATATNCDGVAYHFAVDTDAPKHLHLRWPGASRVITDDDQLSTAAWSGLLSAPTPQHLKGIASALKQTAEDWSFIPFTEPVFSALLKRSTEDPNLPTTLTSALHAADWELGLRHHALLVSPLWNSPPYLVLAHHLIASLDRFLSIYNGALADYRKQNGIGGSSRPMPDLQTGPNEFEAPFWLDDLSEGTRQRATMYRGESTRWELRARNDRFSFDPATDGWAAADCLSAWLHRHQLRLSPRALTLTMYLRLLLADQFVHGIGGGRYDQVTDTIIGRFFGIAPPRFAVTTATMYFPTAAGQRRVNLRPLLQEGRRIRHGMLSETKQHMVRQIAGLPRLSTQRREVFFQMHRHLAGESDSPGARQWEAEFRAAQATSAQQRVLFDRELFFAIQPRDRLASMIERYETAMKA